MEIKMASDKTTVWLLFREVSDQYCTDELVGVFVNEVDARSAENSIKDRRSWIKAAPVGRIFRQEHGSYGDYV